MPSQAMQHVMDGLRAQRAASAGQAQPTLAERRATFAAAGRPHPVPDDVLVTDVTAGGGPAHWLAAPGTDAGRVLLFLHGGVLSSARSAATASSRPGWDGPAGCGCCSRNTAWRRSITSRPPRWT